MLSKLHKLDYWVFDLDNTLYPHDCDLFAQVDIKMGQYIAQKLKLPMDEARILQKKLFHFHGTTLHGLQQDYDINPEEYLKFTHDIDYTVIPKNPTLAKQLKALKGKKFIFTNGPHNHAIATLQQIGIEDIFEGIFDIKQAGYDPKPMPHIYDIMLASLQIKDASSAIMLDDIAKNLVPASKLGMKTVLVEAGLEYSAEECDSYLDYKIEHLCDFLDEVLSSRD